MIKLSGTSTTTCKTSYPGFCYKLCRANVRCSLKVNGWLHRTLSLLHSCLRRARKKRLGCLRRTPRRLAGRLASPNSPQGGVSVGFAELAKNGSVAFGELPAGWRVGSCGSGVRLRLKPKSNITMQAEPAFDRLTAVQPPPNTICLFVFYNLKPTGAGFCKLFNKTLVGALDRVALAMCLL